jgi:tetratricopeptide (TPR) repeat protein
MRLPKFKAGLTLAALACLLMVPVQGQDPASALEDSTLYPETPTLDESVSLIRLNWELEGVESAIQSGFLSIAESLADKLLQEDLTTDVTQSVLNKRLQIALAMGKLEKARSAYLRLQSENLGVQPLLEAMFFYFSGQWDAFRSSIAQINRQDLSRADRSWLILLQALQLTREGAIEAANQAFLRAERSAPTRLIADHFEIIRLREDLKTGIFDQETISALREAVRSMKGERGGFEAARLLAVALNRSGEPNLAIEVLSTHLALPGLREFGFRSDFLLLLGSIAGADSTRGRLALRQLVSEASAEPKDLAIAFTLLAQSYNGPDDREAFLADLAQWLAMSPAHPLTDRMLAFQAFLLIEKGAFSEAETSALQLVNGYPNSGLVPTALRLLAYISWNQKPPRYRTAADYLNQLRLKLPPGPELLKTGILIADCFFLNEDYSNASDAYGAALNDASADLAPDIFFQRVLSEIGANRVDAAAKLIDGALADSRLDLAVVWKAEWNLLDFLRRNTRVPEAFARIESILARSEDDAGNVPPSLFLRLKWIAARLTLEANQPLLAEQRARQLLDEIDSGRYESLSPDLLRDVEANLLLLTGEARYGRAEKASALQVFSVLRERYPQSGPTILSYLVESRAESNQDNLVSAQQSLINLVDRFPDSEYAPIALWEAALNAAQRGLAIHLQEAITILERLVTEYPDHELVYYARVKQGDLARRLNDFPTALLLYERVLSQYPGHPERYRAELSRADCLMALGSEDPSRYDAATVIYERACLLSEAPAAIRMESGYKWAHALREQGDPAGSEGVLWLLYERFILDPNRSQPVLTEQAGRYWMARVLLELGEIQEEKGETAAAIRIFDTLLHLDLPGTALAMAKLELLR